MLNILVSNDKMIMRFQWQVKSTIAHLDALLGVIPGLLD